ncbi:Cyclic nucleotide-gated channel rod photoreceptor subunit alpha, partial [Orchesella cincta]
TPSGKKCKKYIPIFAFRYRRVQETYFNIWNKMKGVSPTALFTALPPTLKTDVLRQLYEPSLRSSPIFQNLDGPGIRVLSTSLTEMFYPEGEFLMKFGDLSNEVFLVAKGIVVCYNIRGDIMSQLGPGSLIGEIAAVFNTHRLYSAIAVKDVTAYVFRRDFFMHFLSLYPDLKKVLELCSVKHYKEAMGSKKTGNQDFDVLLTYQNEIDVHQKQPKASQDSQNDDDQSKRETMGSLALGQVLGQDKDITRNVLQEDLFKTAEDFSKGSVDKWWSVFVTFGRRARDEMGLVHIYQELGQVNIFNFIIHPASSVCSWVSFCLLLTAMSCSVTAYEIAFYTESAITSATLPALRYTLECFFVVRILGNFHLGYYDETANLIVDVRTISRRYACKMDGLVLDLITTFPFYLISYFTSLKSEYMRGVRLLRVFLFVRYLNETDSDLKMKASRVKILKITILLCFIFHFWACAWYLVACYQAVCTRGSWMDKTLKDLGLSPSDVTITSRYLLSLYYVTTALTYTGFADITGRTTIELSITIVMIFVTVFLIGYLLGEMTQCLASQVATKIHYQHKLSILESHYAALGLSSTKIDEVRHYFKLLWCRCKGVMLYSLMEELPYPLRADVAMEIYGPNLKSSRLLGKLDDNLIRQISAKIRHEIYFPGSHIVRAGDVCTSMYFIKKGEIVILDGNSNLELCVEVLYENECFGEVKILLPREQYRFSYIARLESEVGVLFKDDLDEVLKSHPRVFDDLREKANRVKSRRQSIKEDEERGVGNLSGGVSSMSIKSAPSQAVGGASAKALAETT